MRPELHAALLRSRLRQRGDGGDDGRGIGAFPSVRPRVSWAISRSTSKRAGWPRFSRLVPLHGDGRFQRRAGFGAGQPHVMLARLGRREDAAEKSPRLLAGRRQADARGLAGGRGDLRDDRAIAQRLAGEAHDVRIQREHRAGGAGGRASRRAASCRPATCCADRPSSARPGPRSGSDTCPPRRGASATRRRCP